MGPKKVASNNKRWGDKVKKRKEELAKNIDSSKALEKAKGGSEHPKGSFSYYKQRAKEKKEDGKNRSLADVFAAKNKAGGQGLSPK